MSATSRYVWSTKKIKTTNLHRLTSDMHFCTFTDEYTDNCGSDCFVCTRITIFPRDASDCYVLSKHIRLSVVKTAENDIEIRSV